MSAIVEVEDLRISYGKLEAVRGVTFSIPERTIFGLLGPNGAGKTSIIEMIEGLRTPGGGHVRVCGLRPIEDALKVRQILGAQLQSTSLPDKIRVREVFELFASFYAHPADVDKLLDWVTLRHKGRSFYDSLSGGEKQRVALGLALVGDPQVLFLDEPTTGLDAKLRRELHELILRIRAEGKSVLLSTHYIEEAERLCDQVGILSQGELHAIGAPKQLILEHGAGDRLEVALRDPMEIAEMAQCAGADAAHAVEGDGMGNEYVLHGRSGGKMLAAIAIHADKIGNELLEARIAHTTLEDVYLKLTGRSIGE
ncbi:MAG: ABC transporter ATP-binding protein [Acidobacteria bacterium]|nr:MAG: ABC transporter ATP-binding protein [Acidobacteriota bacterium]